MTSCSLGSALGNLGEYRRHKELLELALPILEQEGQVWPRPMRTIATALMRRLCRDNGRWGWLKHSSIGVLESCQQCIQRGHRRRRWHIKVERKHAPWIVRLWEVK